MMIEWKQYSINQAARSSTGRAAHQKSSEAFKNMYNSEIHILKSLVIK